MKDFKMVCPKNMFPLALSLLCVTFSPVVFSQQVDFGCVLKHCSKETIVCVANTTCRDALTCLGGCGSGGNMTCPVGCLFSYGYEDEQFLKLLSCTTVQNKCMSSVPSTFNCTKPQKLAQNFTFDMLKGRWYGVRGRNPPQDCYPCYSYLYVPDTTRPKGDYVMTNTFDFKTLTGETRHIKIEFSEEPTANPAIWKATGSTLGVKGLSEVNEEWRAVALAPDHADGDTLLTYYCGTSMGIGYEGMMLFSRSQTLSSGGYLAAKTAALAHGYDLDKFCSPDQAHCSKR
ncbi:Hypp7811 [Branchiostoma lanceolatum]|uniref:Hypp7811 protein n=1 Tax=Branchiostoma lanceolatum TaxID=7740 RepID=A0A8J9Z481_BRALA|nr:Hypp7811 [Branchiostoma lanceolatum]